MSKQKRIILNTFGSFGDIHPYMAIAMELQRRGHVPVVATMAIYREKVEGAGLKFATVRPNIPQPKEQDPELIEKIMEPKTGPRFLTEGLVFPAVRDSYADLLAACRRERIYSLRIRRRRLVHSSVESPACVGSRQCSRRFLFFQRTTRLCLRSGSGPVTSACLVRA